MNEVIRELEAEVLRTDIPTFNIGDTLKVFFKVVEGKKERVQPFEGVVTKVQNGGISRSFTVRKILQGVGIEKTFLFNSPRLTEVKILREGKARRAKLLYLRDKIGTKANRIKAKDPRFN